MLLVQSVAPGRSALGLGRGIGLLLLATAACSQKEESVECTDCQESTPWPSLSEPWGHAHPTCFEEYGLTPTEIENTPCSEQDPSGDTEITACRIDGSMDLSGTGDNVRLDCVYLITSSGASTSIRCGGEGGCENFQFIRSTCVGGGGAASGRCLGFTSAGGESFRSAHIDRSDVYNNEIPLFVQFGSPTNLPGTDVSFLMTESRVHGVTNGPDFHTDVVFIVGPGVHRIQSSALYADDASGNVGSTLQAQSATTEVSRVEMVGSFATSDSSGHMFNVDRTAGMLCTQLRFEDNVWDWKSDTLFNTSSAEGKDCVGVTERPSSVCTGNTDLEGTPLVCTGSGK